MINKAQYLDASLAPEDHCVDANSVIVKGTFNDILTALSEGEKNSELSGYCSQCYPYLRPPGAASYMLKIRGVHSQCHGLLRKAMHKREVFWSFGYYPPLPSQVSLGLWWLPVHQKTGLKYWVVGKSNSPSTNLSSIEDLYWYSDHCTLVARTAYSDLYCMLACTVCQPVLLLRSPRLNQHYEFHDDLESNLYNTSTLYYTVISGQYSCHRNIHTFLNPTSGPSERPK